MTWTLLHSDFRKVKPPVPKPGQRVCVIFDAPYSETTHTGRRTGSSVDGYGGKSNRSHAGSGGKVAPIKYAALTKPMVTQTVKWFMRLNPEFVVAFGDDTTAQWWKAAFKKAGLYTFAPIIWCKPDAAPRKAGEGPDSSTESIVIARHMKRIRRYCNRPGFYFEWTASTRGRNGKANPTPGQKPMTLMRKLILDYSEPGDLIVDPFAGTGSTLLAAVLEGRDAWGTEIDEGTCRIARQRLTDFDRQPTLLPLMMPTRARQVDAVKTAKWDVGDPRLRKNGAALEDGNG